MNPVVISGLVIGALIFLTISGLLYRIFINVLMTAAIVTFTGWILLLITGFTLCYGLPIYAGVTGKNLVTVYRNLEQGRW